MSSNYVTNPQQPTAFELLLTQLSNELGTVIPQGKMLDMNGVPTAVVDIVKQLIIYLSFYTITRTDYLAWRQSVANRRQAEPDAKDYVRQILTAVAPILGNQKTALAQLGIAEPKEKTPLTAEQKVAAAAKRQATREKLHTLGSRQKKAVLAEGGPVVTVTNVTASPATPPANGTTKTAS